MVQPDSIVNGVGLILNFVEYLLNQISKTMEVFLRYNFGERYLGYIFPLLILALITLGSMVPTALTTRGTFSPATAAKYTAGFIYNLFPILLLVMIALHKAVAWRRKRLGGGVFHSYYEGTSYLEWIVPKPISQVFIRRWLEPIGLLIFSFILVGIFPQIGGWVFYGAISMFLLGQLQKRREKHYILNILDKQIEAGVFSEILEERSIASELLRAGTVRPAENNNTVVEASQQKFTPAPGTKADRLAELQATMPDAIRRILDPPPVITE